MDAPPPRSVPRRRFLGASAATVALLLAGCGDDDDGGGEGAVGRVIVIGAGAAGMTAAFHLARRGVDVTVLEASSAPGGRCRHQVGFSDFPISLGGEWLHVGEEVLAELTDDESVLDRVSVVGYGDDDEVGFILGDRIETSSAGEFDANDQKFVGTSWFGVFESEVLPTIADRIDYDTPVVAVDSTGDGVRCTDAAGDTHDADRVIVTVPLAILQRGDITFEPPLPTDRQAAIDRATIWSGLKMFIRFEERFFPAYLAGENAETTEGQLLYYDAGHGQDIDHAVLGLFSVGAQAEELAARGDGLLPSVLAALDALYDGAATASYVDHLVQDWNAEPWANGAYLEDDADSSISATLAGSPNGKVFFAGDAYTSFDDWSSVHTAIRSAIETVDDLLA